MHYTIITNPAAGDMLRGQRRSGLSEAAEVLGAETQGLDTTSKEELAECAKEAASRSDVVVVAGGDGTFSDIFNAVETSETTLAFLPLGTGNALGHALGAQRNLREAALQIKNGTIHHYDLIDCDHRRRAFMASVGIEGEIISLRDQYSQRGVRGFAAYFMALFHAYCKHYSPPAAHIKINGSTIGMDRLLTLMVMKQPYYGFGLNVMPHAKFNDGKLHALCISAGTLRVLWGMATSLTVGNRTGQYRTGKCLHLSVERPLTLQIDGNKGWESDKYTFTILPKYLRIKH